MKKILVGVLASISLASMITPARAAELSPTECAVWVAGRAGVEVELARLACVALDEAALDSGSPEVPTLLMAWPGAGAIKDGGGVGFPVGGVCVLAGAFADPDSVQYVLAGSAQSVGPAVETRIACGAGPLFAEGELIGPVAVAATTETAALQAMSVCTVARGTFIDGSVTRSRVPDGCSPRPSFL